MLKLELKATQNLIVLKILSIHTSHYFTLPPNNSQPNLFHNQLRDMFDSNDPLIAFADTIDLEEFDKSFEKYYSDNG